MKAALTPQDVARHVREARRGSQAAYAWLYRRFSPLVYSIHLARTSRAHADDLVQETFATAFDRLGQLQADDRFGPWIATIARRMPPSSAACGVDWGEADDPACPSAGPDTKAEARQLLHAVRRLPEAYRDTLLMRLVEGLSGPEIAALTGLTPESVRVNLHRGMAKLRDALGLVEDVREVSNG